MKQTYFYEEALTIRVILRNGNRALVVHALVDSGADICVFPLSFGQDIGIDVKNVEPELVIGINGESKGWFHTLEIYIYDKFYDIKCAFMEDTADGILGLEGLFSNFIVKIDHHPTKNKRYIELTKRQ